jgi:hypothetical protein
MFGFVPQSAGDRYGLGLSHRFSFWTVGNVEVVCTEIVSISGKEGFGYQFVCSLRSDYDRRFFFHLDRGGIVYGIANAPNKKFRLEEP